jgi:hypothetical protein
VVGVGVPRVAADASLAAGDGLIPLTSNEIRRLYATLVLAIPHTADHILAWSAFRQHCNQRARATHYRKRLSTLGSYEPP